MIDFEVWVKRYYPEQELHRLPSGSYRNTTTRLLEDIFNGEKEMIAQALLESLKRRNT